MTDRDVYAEVCQILADTEQDDIRGDVQGAEDDHFWILTYEKYVITREGSQFTVYVDEAEEPLVSTTSAEKLLDTVKEKLV